MKPESILFRGMSMFPVLRPGDVLKIDSTLFEQLRVGDLVAVDVGVSELPVVHRIVGWRRRDPLIVGILKGDSSCDIDRFELSVQNYGGRVWSRDRNGRRFDFSRPQYRYHARFLAMLSKRNLTPGALRIRLKKPIHHWIGWLPLRGSITGFVVRNLKYFLFPDPLKGETLLATFKGNVVGEVRFKKNGPTVDDNSVSFPFSLFISSKSLQVEAAKRFPSRFSRR